MKNLIILLNAALAAVAVMLMTGCATAGPVLSGNGYALNWIQADPANVVGWHVYSRAATVPDLSTNYVLRATVDSLNWPLPTTEPVGTVFVVTSYSLDSESIASNPWTNNIPASPANLSVK